MKSKVLFIVAIALVFGIGVVSYLHWHTHHKMSPDRKVIVDIGAYPTIQAEQRASLQKLSSELYQHPEASAVRIVAGKSAWRQGVMGFVRISSPRNKNVFWYDDRFSSPDFGYVKGHSRFQGISAMCLVSEEPIHVVAHRNGLADDVLPYNEKLRVQLGIDTPKTIIATKHTQNKRL